GRDGRALGRWAMLPGMNRRSLLIRAASLAAVGGAAWWVREHLVWPAPELAFGPGGATTWMRYGRRSAAPTVPVEVAGRTVLALIDSRAQYSAIHRALFAELPPAERSLFAMPLVAYGVGGGAQMGRGTDMALGMPSLTL